MHLALIGPLAHAGLALATGLGACFNASMLFLGLRRRGIYQPQPGWRPFLARLVPACLALSATLWALAGTPEWWLHAGIAARLGRLTLVISAGVAAYFLTLLAVGLRLKEFYKRASN